MSLWNRKWFKEPNNSSAGAAKERLEVMIAAQRSEVGDGRTGSSLDPKLLYKIQAEIMLVLEKYVRINREDLKIDISNPRPNLEVLEVSVPLGEDRIVSKI